MTTKKEEKAECGRRIVGFSAWSVLALFALFALFNISAIAIPFLFWWSP